MCGGLRGGALHNREGQLVQVIITSGNCESKFLISNLKKSMYIRRGVRRGEQSWAIFLGFYLKEKLSWISLVSLSEDFTVQFFCSCTDLAAF